MEMLLLKRLSFEPIYLRQYEAKIDFILGLNLLCYWAIFYSVTDHAVAVESPLLMICWHNYNVSPPTTHNLVVFNSKQFLFIRLFLS